MEFGILPTWTRSSTCAELPNWLIPILNIPIDHIFVTRDLQVVRTYVGDNGNSDHAPIISELAIYASTNYQPKIVDRSEF
jgi:endonuclease/exonuclease/phosphatase (EEP) superfamily protein YafD